jgi:hypothetical protein
MALVLSISGLTWAGSGENLLQFIPSNKAIVVHVNLEQVRSTPMYDMIWGMIQTNADFQSVIGELETSVGFNPTTDLSSMMIAVDVESEQDFLMLVEGNFDASRISTFLVGRTEVSAVDYQGQTMYYSVDGTINIQNEQQVYFSFLNNHIIVAGTQTAVQGAIELHQGEGENITSLNALRRMIQGVDKTGAFWFAGVLPAAMQGDMATSPMAGMNSVNGFGDLNSGLSVGYNIGTGTGEQATAIEAYLSDNLTQARVSPEVQQMGLSDVLNGITVTSSGNEVSVRVNVPEETFNNLLSMFAALISAEGM